MSEFSAKKLGSSNNFGDSDHIAEKVDCKPTIMFRRLEKFNRVVACKDQGTVRILVSSRFKLSIYLEMIVVFFKNLSLSSISNYLIDNVS